jgi:Ca2+/Na+ antiporter
VWAMGDDIKIYYIGQARFLMAIIMIILAAINSFIYFLLPGPISFFTSILWLIGTILWCYHFYFLKNNVHLATTEERIILSQGPVRKILEINTTRIEKIKRKSPTKFVIYFSNDIGNKQKRNIYLWGFKGSDQIDFNHYIDRLISKRNIEVI